MPVYHRLGDIPHKRHTQFRQPDGSLYAEELFGTMGFDGAYSLLYHHHSPTEVVSYEQLTDKPLPDYLPDSNNLRHHHLRLGRSKPEGDFVSGRKFVMRNDDIAIGVVTPNAQMDYFFSNGNQDELIFVHDGTGKFLSTFGSLEYRPGDYIVVPKGTVYQMELDLDKEQRFLVVETPGLLQLPRRYYNEMGQLLEHAPFYVRDFRLPQPMVPKNESGDFLVKVRTWRSLMAYHLGHHPFDVVGWDGYLFPYILNINDFEPITGRIHQPPSVHQTFAGQNFVVCSFVPRLFDYHPQAIPLPYNHSNLQSDEVLYYVNGNFMSRRGIERGSLTMHPCGIPHGPHPGTVEASLGASKTDEVAVMIDTFKPLRLTEDALLFDDANYPLSWVAK